MHDANALHFATAVQHCNADTSDSACSICSVADHNVETKGTFDNMHTCKQHRFIERALHFGTGLISACMHDATVRVPTFTCESNTFVNTRVKRCSELHQVANCCWCFRHQRAHCLFVAQTSSGLQSVLHMIFNRVIRIKNCSKSTLGPTGASGIKCVFGDQHHVAHGAKCESCGQTSSTGSENDHICFHRPCWFGGGELARYPVIRQHEKVCQSQSCAPPTNVRDRRCREAHQRCLFR